MLQAVLAIRADMGTRKRGQPKGEEGQHEKQTAENQRAADPANRASRKQQSWQATQEGVHGNPSGVNGTDCVAYQGKVSTQEICKVHLLL